MAALSSAWQDSVGSYIDRDVCVHSPGSTNGCECVTKQAHRCVVLLLQQCEYILVDMLTLWWQWWWPASEIRFGPMNFAVDKFPGRNMYDLAYGMFCDLFHCFFFKLYMPIYWFPMSNNHKCIHWYLDLLYYNQSNLHVSASIVAIFMEVFFEENVKSV
jgi:hypothetical protein